MTFRRISGILLLLLGALCSVHPAYWTTQASSGDAELNLLSFNIRYGSAKDGTNSWMLRKGFVVQLIKDTGAGIVGLQEALRFQIDEIRSSLSSFDEVGVGRDDGDIEGEYSALIYDTTRFRVEDQSTFWYSDTPEIPGSKNWGNTITRICTWARFRDLRAGNEFYVYNTHFDHRSQPSRERSAVLLQERIASRQTKDPVIVMGDFNAGENNPAIRFLTRGTAIQVEEGSITPTLILFDTFRRIHPGAKVVGTFNGFEGRSDGEKIDYILASPDVEVLDAGIRRDHFGGRYPSDHFAVSAIVRLVQGAN